MVAPENKPLRGKTCLITGGALRLGRASALALAQAGAAGSAGQGWQTSLTPSMGGGLTSTVSYTDATGAVWLFPYTGALTAPSASVHNKGLIPIPMETQAQ